MSTTARPAPLAAAPRVGDLVPFPDGVSGRVTAVVPHRDDLGRGRRGPLVAVVTVRLCTGFNRRFRVAA